MKQIALKSLYILATGGILFSFSERFFWGFVRVGDDDLGGLLWGILFYTLTAYLILFLIDRFKVSNLRGLFFVGLLFAYIIEGLLVGQLYASPLLNSGVAFPWHALVTLIFGWYYLPRLLNGRYGYRKLFGVLIAFGLLYGFWAIGWRAQAHGEILTLHGFYLNIAVLVPFLALCYNVVSFVERRTLITYSTKEFYIVSASILALHAVTLLPFLIITLPVTAVVAALSYVLLRKIKKNSDVNAALPLALPTTTARTYLLLIPGGIGALIAYYAFAQNIIIETAYLYAIPLLAIALWLGSTGLARIVRNR